MNEENLIKYYNKFNEDKRLTRRHGQVEFITTIKYIKKELENISNPKILDVGAGTGRYSIYLDELGCDVTAIELIKHNLRIIEKNNKNVKAYLGNAIDLSRFKDNSFDIVLLFGPMYHLIPKNDRIKALEEAKRVSKKIIMIQYYMNDYAIIKHGFLDNNIMNAINNKIIDKNYKINSNPKDLYYYSRLEEIDELNNIVNLKRKNILTPDGLTDLFRKDINKMSEEVFNEYISYHLSVCEKKEMFGYASHILDILEKKDN